MGNYPLSCRSDDICFSPPRCVDKRGFSFQVYWLGPMCGGIAAALIYNFLLSPRTRDLRTYRRVLLNGEEQENETADVDREDGRPGSSQWPKPWRKCNISAFFSTSDSQMCFHYSLWVSVCVCRCEYVSVCVSAFIRSIFTATNKDCFSSSVSGWLDLTIFSRGSKWVQHILFTFHTLTRCTFTPTWLWPHIFSAIFQSSRSIQGFQVPLSG